MPRQQTVSRLFRTVLDGEFCSSSLLSLALLRSVQPLFIYLINDLGGWFHSLFEREREREREREGQKERKKERAKAQLLQFRFAYIRIRSVFDRHRQLRCGRQHATGNEIILLLEYSSRYTRRIFYPFYR